MSNDQGNPSVPGNARAPAGDRVLSAAPINFPIVGIGASAGGLEAFTELLKHLPLDTGMAFVLVQHLDPQHESALTHLLALATSLPVREVTNNLPVEANHVYVIPPNTNLAIVEGILKLEPRQASVPHRPIDAFFESLARDQRHRTAGVVLSGTATDGTLGLEAIKAEGGITFAQDDSAKYDSMPRSAVAAGCVDFVLSPRDIASELARIAKHPFVAQPSERITPHGGAPSPEDDRASAREHEDEQTPLPSGGRGTTHTGTRQARTEAASGHRAEPQSAENDYKKILLLLRNHSGVDFSLYRSTTIRRRIHRRMVLSTQTTLSDYVRFLRDNAKELDALYTDALISVTSFFRNPEAFDVLLRKVLPELLQQRGNEPIRCWVLGCSTGQEAYSMAMALVEAADRAPHLRKLQIFATDLNAQLLDKARHGLYAKNLAEDVTPERLRRFFVEEEGGYRVSKTLREMVVFARQNLINDPPFSRMDLISCRNLLIYLEPSLQQKAMPTFHYALKPGGFLLLGASESIGGFTDLFEVVDKKHKIFSKKAAGTPAFHLPVRNEQHRQASRPPLLTAGQPGSPPGFRGEINAQREADRVTVNQFAPPGVLVNADLQVLQFRGATGAYLEPPPGKASFDVLKMAREGLMLPLRAAIDRAKEQDQAASQENVRVKRNGETRMVNLQVIPLKNLHERCYLILFEDAARGGPVRPAAPQASAVPLTGQEEARRIAELETELSETRDYLQSMQEQHEATNEELQAANEEVQSANEELQSINEELETSKEELESANEELTTVNEEMSHRNIELNRLNSDLVNFQTATRLAVVLLDRDLTIRRFTAQAEKLLQLASSDVGRRIGNIRHNLIRAPGPGESAPAPLDLEHLGAEVVASVREQECEVQDQAGRWYSLGVRPYMTLDNRVDGAVMVLVDIDALKQSVKMIAAARDYAEDTVATVRDPLLVLDQQLRVESANRSFYRTFQVSPDETVGRFVYDLGNRQWDIPRLRELLGEILSQRTTVEDFLVEHDFEILGRRTMLLNARRIEDPQRDDRRILLAIEDISERSRLEKQAQEQTALLADLNRRKDEFLAMLSHELRNPLAPILNAVHILRHQGDEDPVRQQARAIIERQAGQLKYLVDDLLEVSRVTSGRIHLHQERLDLRGVVEHSLESVRPLLDRCEHALSVSLPPEPVWVHADGVRLEQVVVNLLSNAAKYTPRAGQIWLSVGQEGGEAVLRVRDTGIGIEAKLLPRIFDLFTQAERSLGRSQGGLGIGLTLVQRLVELHRGRVEAQSGGTGHGSEFTVRLPVLPSPEAFSRSVPGEAAKQSGRRMRVLVVDDNVDSADSVALMLRMAGNEAQPVYSGEMALATAAEYRPDCVLLDIGLPDMDGYEVACHLRQNAQLKDVRLIALTGYGQDSDRQRSREAGFDHHLVKPVDVEQLEAILSSTETQGTAEG